MMKINKIYFQIKVNTDFIDEKKIYHVPNQKILYLFNILLEFD